LRTAARAMRAVFSGTGWIGLGLSDMAGLRRRGETLPPTRPRQPSDFVNGIWTFLMDQRGLPSSFRAFSFGDGWDHHEPCRAAAERWSPSCDR